LRTRVVAKKEISPVLAIEYFNNWHSEHRDFVLRRFRLTPRWGEMDSNSWYGGTNSLGFPKHPGIAGGSSTGEGDVGGGLRRRRL